MQKFINADRLVFKVEGPGNVMSKEVPPWLGPMGKKFLDI